MDRLGQELGPRRSISPVMLKMNKNDQDSDVSLVAMQGKQFQLGG